MLSDKDIEKLIKALGRVFATKEEVNEKFEELKDQMNETKAIAQATLVKFDELKEEVEETKGIAQETLAAVEPLASFIDRQQLENAATTTQLKRHKGWIQQVAKETNVAFAG